MLISTLTHGHAVGGKLSPTYVSWKAMKQRCFCVSHRQYADYGGRGIVVCERWRQDFGAFLADMGTRPDGATLDRINNDGNYEHGNCRWATRLEQSQNKRSNGTQKLTAEIVREIRRRYAVDGETQESIATSVGVRQHTISRIVRGQRWARA